MSMTAYAAPALPSASSSKALPEGGEVDVCYLVNTAEYCADTVPQVGRKEGSGWRVWTD